MRTIDTNVEAAALACLSEAVEQLLEEARAKAGSEEGLFAYAVLARIKNNALALGVPLEAVGLAGLDLEGLLQKTAPRGVGSPCLEARREWVPRE